MTDADEFIRLAHITNSLREPVLRAAIQALHFPLGSHGLDAACGVGLQALLLAEQVGPAGHVTGLDLSPAFLAHARDVVQEAGLSQRISFREGDVNQLPFDDDNFNWAWSVDCVGYAPMDPLPPMRELIRVVKPGGTVALLAWSSEQLLPGHPLLEARLQATASGMAPFIRGQAPGKHFMRALGWFRALGLSEPKAQTFACGVHAPLSAGLRSALVALFEMRWPGVESELAPEDWAAYQRLCLPASPDFVIDHPDYCAFFTYSMFHARV